jgi:hypothetical protein
MNIAISPNFKAHDFPNGIFIEDKIIIFSDRVVGWQIDIARNIIQSKIPHSDFAILKILISYFEMIAKYYEGYSRNDGSKKYFVKGLKYTFPELNDAPNYILEEFYNNIRNSLYHNGFTNHRVIITNNIDCSFRYDQLNKLIVVCPTNLAFDIKNKFSEYIKELNNLRNIELREKFEARYDFENQKLGGFQ